MRRCMYPTRSSYWATYRNIPWYLLVDAYLLRANAMTRRLTSNLVLITCLYVRVTTVLTRNYCLGNWTALLVRNPTACLLPIPVRGTCGSYVDRPHDAGCYASPSSVVLTDTERWLDGLLYCSRCWTLITTIGWCCLFLNTPAECKSRLPIMLVSQRNVIVAWNLPWGYIL